MKKKGVSPIIASILLIALVVVIGLIIFTWFKGMTQESITKFDGQNINIVCEDVEFDAEIQGSEMIITNLGNVPIYAFEMRTENLGDYDTETIQKQINSGGIETHPVNSGGDITLIPILLGINEDGIKKTTVCQERHGIIVY